MTGLRASFAVAGKLAGGPTAGGSDAGLTATLAAAACGVLVTRFDSDQTQRAAGSHASKAVRCIVAHCVKPESNSALAARHRLNAVEVCGHASGHP